MRDKYWFYAEQLNRGWDDRQQYKEWKSGNCKCNPIPKNCARGEVREGKKRCISAEMIINNGSKLGPTQCGIWSGANCAIEAANYRFSFILIIFRLLFGIASCFLFLFRLLRAVWARMHGAQAGTWWKIVYNRKRTVGNFCNTLNH